MERIGVLIKYSNEELILKILPVLDNIYLAEKELPKELKEHKWTEGILRIKKQISEFLKQEGVEEIKAEGENFDPNFMEITEEVESDKEKNVIIEVIQKGYTLNNKVIRPARVK